MLGLRTLLLILCLAGAARAQPAVRVSWPQKTVTYLSADERVLAGPDSADFRVETTRFDSARATVRRYYASGGLQQYVPYLDWRRGVVHGTRTTWYEDGQLCTKEDYVGGSRHGELLTYYPDGRLKRRDAYARGQALPGACYGPDGRPVAYFPYEQSPLYPGGTLLLYNDVRRRVRPTTAEIRQFSFADVRALAAKNPAGPLPVGEIDVAFTVTERGEVADPYVAKSSAPWLNEKVLAAVRGLSKRFRPGERDGQAVRATCHVPVVFYVSVPYGPVRNPGRPGRY